MKTKHTPEDVGRVLHDVLDNYDGSDAAPLSAVITGCITRAGFELDYGMEQDVREAYAFYCEMERRGAPSLRGRA